MVGRLISVLCPTEQLRSNGEGTSVESHPKGWGFEVYKLKLLFKSYFIFLYIFVSVKFTCDTNSHKNVKTKHSSGFREGLGGSLESHLGPKYFDFEGKFMKNQ